MGPIVLLPGIEGEIAAHYPGTKLAINEWNYGAGSDISGGIATADVLGIFGRDGVAMANNWMGDPSEFAHGAFQLFRNYDMQGSAFGDTSISSSTTDVNASSVYAAYDSTNRNRVTIVAINKSATPKVAGIRVAHQQSFQSAQVYTLSVDAWSKYWQTANPQVASSIQAVATNAFAYTMPAYSVSILIPSTQANVPPGLAWPPPKPAPAEAGWTFDSDLEGWTFWSGDAGGTGTWDGTVGDPDPGSIKMYCPFVNSGDQCSAKISSPNVDLRARRSPSTSAATETSAAGSCSTR